MYNTIDFFPLNLKLCLSRTQESPLDEERISSLPFFRATTILSFHKPNRIGRQISYLEFKFVNTGLQ